MIREKERKAMVPKIFISSTFYDLKYVRENIGSFVENYGFTPIVSETGNIGYMPLQNLDLSCYDAMRAANMAILIVGGRYGSPSSDETMPEDVFKQYKSVTRKEFETAVNNRVPVYVFIEAAVYYEYQTYKKNKSKIEEGHMNIDFASIDNINVFRFISEIYEVKGLPVWSFARVEDIKEKLKRQWATLFLQQLNEIKNNAMQKRLEDPMKTIETVTNKMNILLEKLGERIMAGDNDAIEEVRHKQLVETAAMMISNSFEFCCLNKDQNIEEYLSFFVDKLYEAYDQGILDSGLSNDALDLTLFDTHFHHDDIILVNYKNYLHYGQDVLPSVRNQKNELIDRLMELDCLMKMKLV